LKENIILENYDNFKKNCGKSGTNEYPYYYSKEINISGELICSDYAFQDYDTHYDPDYNANYDAYCGEICDNLFFECKEEELKERTKKIKKFLKNAIKIHNEEVNKNCDDRYEAMKKEAQSKKEAQLNRVFLKDVFHPKSKDKTFENLIHT